MARPREGKCSLCQQPATKICAACANRPNDLHSESTLTTFYCSKACQVKDWTHHQEYCKTSIPLSILHKAGELLRDLLVDLRRMISTTSTTSIIRRGPQLILRDNGSGIDNRRFSKGLACPIPKAALARLSETERRAVHLIHFCTYGNAFVATVLHAILSPVVNDPSTDIKLAVFYPKNINLSVRYPWDDLSKSADDTTHNVIRVTLKDGRHYAMDLTGAQFGWSETVRPWATYVEQKVDLHINMRPLIDFRRDAARKGFGYPPGAAAVARRDVMLLRRFEVQMGIFLALCPMPNVAGRYLEKRRLEVDAWWRCFRDACLCVVREDCLRVDALAGTTVLTFVDVVPAWTRRLWRQTNAIRIERR